MKKGKVYRVKSRLYGSAVFTKHGWLWLLVGPAPDARDPKVGVFRSVATGHEVRIDSRLVEEASDAGG